jgi:DHA1 family tetracycline resistance protein-like MFS transporter
MIEASSPQPRRGAITFIFITVVLDMLASGVIVPVLPKLVVDFPGGDTVQGSLIGPLSRRLGESRVLVLGLLCGAAGFAVHGYAPTSAVFLAGIPLISLWGISGPAVQGMMTQRVSPTEQGALQGANGCIMGIAELAGPGLFTYAFARCLATLPGAPFYLAAVLVAAALAVFWAVRAPAAVSAS